VCWIRPFVLYIIIIIIIIYSNSDVVNTGASVSHMKVLNVMHIVLSGRPIALKLTSIYVRAL